MYFPPSQDLSQFNQVVSLLEEAKKKNSLEKLHNFLRKQKVIDRETAQLFVNYFSWQRINPDQFQIFTPRQPANERDDAIKGLAKKIFKKTEDFKAKVSRGEEQLATNLKNFLKPEDFANALLSVYNKSFYKVDKNGIEVEHPDERKYYEQKNRFLEFLFTNPKPSNDLIKAFMSEVVPNSGDKLEEDKMQFLLAGTEIGAEHLMSYIEGIEESKGYKYEDYQNEYLTKSCASSLFDSTQDYKNYDREKDELTEIQLKSTRDIISFLEPFYKDQDGDKIFNLLEFLFSSPKPNIGEIRLFMNSAIPSSGDKLKEDSMELLLSISRQDAIKSITGVSADSFHQARWILRNPIEDRSQLSEIFRDPFFFEICKLFIEKEPIPETITLPNLGEPFKETFFWELMYSVQSDGCLINYNKSHPINAFKDYLAKKINEGCRTISNNFKVALVFDRHYQGPLTIDIITHIYGSLDKKRRQDFLLNIFKLAAELYGDRIKESYNFGRRGDDIGAPLYEKSFDNIFGSMNLMLMEMKKLGILEQALSEAKIARDKAAAIEASQSQPAREDMPHEPANELTRLLPPINPKGAAIAAAARSTFQKAKHVDTTLPQILTAAAASAAEATRSSNTQNTKLPPIAPQNLASAEARKSKLPPIATRDRAPDTLGKAASRYYQEERQKPPHRLDPIIPAGAAARSAAAESIGDEEVELLGLKTGEKMPLLPKPPAEVVNPKGKQAKKDTKKKDNFTPLFS